MHTNCNPHHSAKTGKLSLVNSIRYVARTHAPHPHHSSVHRWIDKQTKFRANSVRWEQQQHSQHYIGKSKYSHTQAHGHGVRTVCWGDLPTMNLHTFFAVVIIVECMHFHHCHCHGHHRKFYRLRFGCDSIRFVCAPAKTEKKHPKNSFQCENDWFYVSSSIFAKREKGKTWHGPGHCQSSDVW